VPLCWADCEKWQLFKSQNRLEEGLRLVLLTQYGLAFGLDLAKNKMDNEK
jgi:hypothetical protein